MSADPFSLRAIWASLRALPGGVWKRLLPIFIIHAAIATVSEGVVRYNVSENIVAGPVESIVWLICVAVPSTVLFYISTRLIAAHDQERRPTLVFLTTGLWSRYLLPFGLVWLALLTVVGLPLYTLVKASGMSALFWFLCAALALVAVYLGLRLFFLTPIIVFENTGFATAVRCAWSTSASRFGALLKLSIKAVLITVAVSLAWSIAIGLISLPFVLASASSEAEPSGISVAFALLEQLVANTIIAASAYLLSTGSYRLVQQHRDANVPQQA